MLSLVALHAWPDGRIAVHPDTVRDFRLARECRDLPDCVLKGPPSSVPGVQQGFLFVVHLAVLDGLGAGPDDVAAISAVLAAIAVLLAAFLADRGGAPGSGPLAGALLLAAFSWPHDLRGEWNPGLIPFLSTVLTLTAVAAVRSRRAILYFGTALAAVLLVEAHVVGLLWAAAVMVVLVARPPTRPILGFGSAATLAGALYLLMGGLHVLPGPSPAMPTAEAAAAGGSVPALLLAGGLCAIGLVGWRVLRSAGDPGPATLGWLAAAPVAVLATLAFATGRDLTPARYLAAAFAPAGVLAGGVAGAWIGHLARAVRPGTTAAGLQRALSLAGLGLAACVAATTPRWTQAPGSIPTFEETRAVAAALPRLGISSLPEATRRLRSPDLFAWLSGLELSLPLQDPGADEAASDGRPVYVLRSRDPSDADLPPDTVALHPRGATLLLVPRPALGPASFDVAFEPGPDPAAPSFEPVRFEAEVSGPGYPTLRGMPDLIPSASARFRVAVRLPTDAPVTFFAADHAGCRIERVSDLVVDSREARTVRLAAGQAGIAGSIEVDCPTLPDPRLTAYLPTPVLVPVFDGEDGLARRLREAP